MSSVNFIPNQWGGADYAPHITACPAEFENLTASLQFMSLYRGVVPGDAMSPAVLGRSVIPISTGGGQIIPTITTGNPGYSDLPKALPIKVNKIQISPLTKYLHRAEILTIFRSYFGRIDGFTNSF